MTAQYNDEFIGAAEVEGAKRAVVNGKTEKVSPKVYVPAAAALALGIALLALGFDVEGRTLIAAALGTGVLGAAAKPGTVAER